ncbi:hypothetical protein [Loktanella sp. R86503]|uniref:hypothetical protein n=1 Tax=Loktanella sp. R86503 TaxID=3093847 RepID=UPI0036DD4015
MIITTTLGGIAGAIASVLTGMWCGVGVLGLIGLYMLGGTVSFAITLLIALKMQAQGPDQGDH